MLGSLQYVTIKRGERAAAILEDHHDDHQQPYRKQNNTNHMISCMNCHNQYYTPFTYGNKDEEEASLALLIEQLRHKEDQLLEANSLATLSIDQGHAASHRSQPQI